MIPTSFEDFRELKKLSPIALAVSRALNERRSWLTVSKGASTHFFADYRELFPLVSIALDTLSRLFEGGAPLANPPA